ncbi:MAG: phosphoribosylaminoimidazolesuccinocarboxamide synthase [Bacteroidales bacterium]
MNAITRTEFDFPRQTKKYIGKVRDVYFIENHYLVMIATDRISAFDVVLPKGIPYKGQVLNQIASKFLDNTSDIIPNWKIASPDPLVTVGHKCDPFPVEMIVRAYLTGSSWRSYKAGAREICGVSIPDGMKEHQKFEKPILTPTTKAEQGKHDTDITREEIITKGLVSETEYKKLEEYSLALFERGSQIATQRGLILVDTKYEFGKKGDKIYLIDEIHTPDSSRYFYADSYLSLFEQGLPQKQLSKEFVREWLIENGFQGKKGEKIPKMTPKVVDSISERYIELFEKITGTHFEKSNYSHDTYERIDTNVRNMLARL